MKEGRNEGRKGRRGKRKRRRGTEKEEEERGRKKEIPTYKVKMVRSIPCLSETIQAKENGVT